MRVIIRADGGSKIGMGHIMRTSALAYYLKDFAEVVYLCKKGSEYTEGVSYLQKQGYKVIEINEGDMIEGLSSFNGDCLITDSYDVEEKYFSITKELFTITGYIDDLNQCSFDVDFLINQNTYGQDLVYHVNEDTQLFLGPEYALLRKEFFNLPKRKINKKIKNILITMGGADPENMSGKIVTELHDEFSHVVFHVVIGPGFNHIERMKKLEGYNVKLYYNPKMAELMLNCDLAISSCGSTLYELAACGTPTIGVIVAENQKRAAEKMHEIGMVKLAYEPNGLKQLIREFDFSKRRRMSEFAQGLVDGLGGKRLAKEIYNLYIKR